jgi:flagellar biosynthesis/type III secretory pathway protein FliH
MTIAEQLIEEGRQQGREEGREEGRQQGREEGRQQGREEGRQQSWREGWIANLRHLLVFKFKLQALDPSYEARLQVATPEALDRYLVRVLTADSLAAVFAD